MPKFTDQFTARNPRKFKTGILIPTWPIIIQEDAKNLLSEFSDDELVAIGCYVEGIIQGQAQPETFPTDRTSWIWTRVKPEWILGHELSHADSIRDEFGDLNLFLNSIQNAAPELYLDGGKKVESWHMLAVIALWKRLDAYDVTYGHKSDLILRPIRRTDEDRRMYGAGLAMEAQAACSSAIQLSERASHVKNAAAAQAEIERLKRSAQAQNAAIAKHAENTLKRKEAMVWATEKPFDSRAAAARHVADNLAKPRRLGEPLKYYTVDAIDDWLKEDGWKSI